MARNKSYVSHEVRSQKAALFMDIYLRERQNLKTAEEDLRKARTTNNVDRILSARMKVDQIRKRIQESAQAFRDQGVINRRYGNRIKDDLQRRG